MSDAKRLPRSDAPGIQEAEIGLQTWCADELAKFWSDEIGLQSWLEDQATAHVLNFLLAFADDGVIWGRFDSGREGRRKLSLSSGLISESPSLSLDKLQQLRAFGESDEFFLWRREGKWRGRHLSDRNGQTPRDYYDECQVLWGTRRGDFESEGLSPQFTLVYEGQGLRHAVPIKVDETVFTHPGIKQYRPIRLKIRHYLQPDECNFLRVTLSRLVDVFDEKPPKGRS